MLTPLLQTIDGVTLPSDLLHDNTEVVYDANGTPVNEHDKDDPDYKGDGGYDHFVNLGLAHYNGKHGTEYKPVKFKGSRFILHKECSSNSDTIHCGFSASPSSTPVESVESVAKDFFAELQKTDGDDGNEVVISCRIVNGLKTTGCKDCDISMILDESEIVLSLGPLYDPKREEYLNSTKDDEEDAIPPLSEYSHCLADGVTLSDKAKLRLRFALLALKYYNKKRHTDYKLVDVLPSCFTVMGYPWIVCHCNFIAKLVDAPHKLFFAEIQSRGGWKVTACSIVRGKTTAGCHGCNEYKGKRVIHPTRGFRYGLYPDYYFSDRSLRGRR